MEKRTLRKILSFLLAVAMLLALAACGGGNDTPSSGGNNSSNGGGNNSSNGGGGNNDETPSAPIVVTMGRQTTANPKFPDGDNYENNAYTRMAEAELNIDIVDEFEAENGEDYNRQVSLILSGGGMPAMMKVSSKDEVTELYESGMIADLTDVYNQYASDYVKGIYDSFEGRALDRVTYDGKIVAIPATASDAGTSMCWIRQDWVDTLGLTVDEDGDRCLTTDEVKAIAKAFKEGNPEGVDNPVGMAFDSALTAGSSEGTNMINAFAYAKGAYPRLWYYNDNGEMTYGSTTPEMKEALRLVRDWYNEGIIDSQLGTRTWDDITSLLTNGQCGMVFGAWHVADWLLNNVYSLNNNAVFTPYAVIDENGKVNCTHANATGEYVVVNADFEHPELAIEILNLFYDDMVNSQELLDKYPDVNTYLNTGVDGTARPFNIEVKSNTYLLDEYACLKAALEGTGTKEEIPTAEERSNYDSITAYNEGSGDVTGWCKIHSRCKGVDLLAYLTDNNLYNWISPVYPETTETMNTRWSNLQTLEEETFIKIVTGATDLDSGFDEFVSNWKSQGGDTITAEVAEQFPQ